MRHEIFFPIGASLSGGRSLVRRCKENCCGGRKEARPVDINRDRGPVADATDELTPVDIKISLLFLTAHPSSQFLDFFTVFTTPWRSFISYDYWHDESRVPSSRLAAVFSPDLYRLVFTGAFLFTLPAFWKLPIVTRNVVCTIVN